MSLPVLWASFFVSGGLYSVWRGVGLVLYFVGAVVSHLRVVDIKVLDPPPSFGYSRRQHRPCAS